MKEGKAISTQVKHEFLEKVKKIVAQLKDKKSGRYCECENLDVLVKHLEKEVNKWMTQKF